MVWRVWRSASAVTAQELMTTMSLSPANMARIVSLSARFMRQPSETTSTSQQVVVQLE
jgi:tRNA nucleotidyltransferase (CCA-adding enzyme)